MEGEWQVRGLNSSLLGSVEIEFGRRGGWRWGDQFGGFANSSREELSLRINYLRRRMKKRLILLKTAPFLEILRGVTELLLLTV